MWLWTFITFASTAIALACVALTFLELVFIHSVAAVGTARRSFVAAFALSGSLFATMLYGLLGFIAPATAESLLSALVTAQVVTVSCALPFITARAFVRHYLSGRAMYLVSAGFVGAVWAGVAALAAPCAAPDDSSVIPEAAATVICSGWLDFITARAAFVGACLVGLLGGYAIVSTPMAYLEPVLRWRAVALAERRVGDIASRQQHVFRMWSSRRCALAVAVSAKRAAQGSNGSASAGNSGGIFSKLRSAFDNSGSQNEQSLAVECEGYGHVSTGLFLSAQEAIELHHVATTSRTWRGVLFTGYGFVMSLYCATKLLATFGNLVLGRFSAVDPVTRAFALLGLVAGDTPYLASQLSTIALAFNALMVLSAIRGFLILVFRLTCHNRAVTAEASLFAFSLALSLYFLGLATLMRLSLPNDLRALLAQAVGALPFRYYHWWHDVVMLVSAVVTVAVRRLLQDDTSSQE